MRQRLLFLLLLLLAAVTMRAQTNYPFRDPSLAKEERIQNLLDLLTPEEKIGMMMHNSKAVPRLGIPAYNWWSEALHGVARAGKATVFPQAIAMAATWDVPAHLRSFDIISTEARAKYNEAMKAGATGIYHGLSFWTPNINIFRDPRWGRGQETYGEDPYLTSRFGLAAVRGLQGDDPRYFKTHACAKHYAVHSGPEWSRHSYNAIVSPRDLWETYLPAFGCLVQEGNVREVMCAYNALNGEPCCGNNLLLTDILRNKWQYNGMVVTDCWAMNDFFLKGTHETQPNAAAASVDAIIHSTDLECGDVFTNLTSALQAGLISMDKIDASLRKILQGWIELGMLDPKEMVPWSNLSYAVVDAPEHRLQALKMARESMTLLKNDHHVLPLPKNIKTVAVFGPNANDSIMQWGNYNGIPSSTVTILQGLQNKLPAVNWIYEKGCELVDPWVRTSLYSSMRTDEGSRGMKVEFFNNNEWNGNPVVTLDNASTIKYNSAGGTALAPGVNMTNTSTRISGLFVAPYTGEVEFELVASEKCNMYIDKQEVLSQVRKTAPLKYLLQVQKGHSYRVKVEHSQTSKNVEISLSVSQRTPVDFTALAQKAATADAIVFAGGLSPSLEGEEMPVNAEGFKGGDRVSIDLPEVQRHFLAALKKTGKPVIFILCTGSALALEQDQNNYDALLCAWYGGQSAGTAVADVLFGDYNPAGRLPVTFYKSLAQLENGLIKNDDPARKGFENYNMEGRTYRYLRSAPLYPFGYGLSYSSFKYGAATVDKKTVKAGQPVSIAIPVSNVSAVAGDEVVQVYVKHMGDPDAPVKSLRAFQRVFIEPGKTILVHLTLDEKSFQFYDPKSQGMITKGGRYTIQYGGSSADDALHQINVLVK